MCVLHILTMIVLIKFDFEQYKIYIPDGYIMNLENIRSDFFEWIYYQPEYIIYDKSNAILTYGVDDFLKFLNETIFTGCKEKAYIESRNGKKIQQSKLLYRFKIIKYHRQHRSKGSNIHLQCLGQAYVNDRQHGACG